MIESLQPNQIFVFGSNLAGKHIGGAARQAAEHFGAEEGIGEGRTGQCYAFPTLGVNFEQRSDADLKWSVKEFYRIARANPQAEFLLTKVGCGIAGYDEEYIKALFMDAPANVTKPEDWR
jgi:hypothetical protein